MLALNTVRPPEEVLQYKMNLEKGYQTPELHLSLTGVFRGVLTKSFVRVHTSNYYRNYTVSNTFDEKKDAIDKKNRLVEHCSNSVETQFSTCSYSPAIKVTSTCTLIGSPDGYYVEESSANGVSSYPISETL